MECHDKECVENTNSLIRKIHSAEERVRHLRHAALLLAGGDKQALRKALDMTVDKLRE